MSKQSTYKFDAQTQDVVNSLREKLGYSSSAEVLVMAITLLNIVADAKLNGGTTVIGGKEVVL